MLKLNDIRAGYGQKEVLKGVSLDVAAGEIVALLGPNGAGKSTVLKVVAGLLTPVTGTVTFCERDVTRMPTHRRARIGIGYLMQNGPVFGSLTIAEHQRLVTAGRGSDHAGFLQIGKHKRGGVLSGGERQRLAVDLCLRRNPRLLLLDEPSAGVAPNTATEIYQEMKERIIGTETAVLVVEQKLQFLPNFVSRVIVMRNGEISTNSLPLEHLENSEAMFEAFFGAAVVSR